MITIESTILQDADGVAIFEPSWICTILVQGMRIKSTVAQKSVPDTGDLQAYFDSRHDELLTQAYGIYGSQKSNIDLFRQSQDTAKSITEHHYLDSGLPKSEHIAKLKAINLPPAVKPATVTRKFMDELYDVNCFVTQGVKDEYAAGKIQIGDYVTVSFISEYPDGEEKDVAIVTGKVFRSW